MYIYIYINIYMYIYVGSHLHAHLLHMPIIQCNFHPFTFYLPFDTSPPVDQCPIHAPSNCTMGFDTCARHSLFGRTDPYYTVIFYSSCGLDKRPATTLAIPLSVSVMSSQYLIQRGSIWVIVIHGPASRQQVPWFSGWVKDNNPYNFTK